MPRREDLETIMVLGSCPIKIGQGAEFDFSGSQAVRALREDGYKVILVNSNPATIQNDPEMADVVYIEPLLTDTVRDILEAERPDALLAGMGGQTALNIASELAHDGSLERLGVELIGSDLDAIDTLIALAHNEKHHLHARAMAIGSPAWAIARLSTS